MATEKPRSPFAQALYDLMIKPGIYTIEAWCEFINPWVVHKHADGGETHTFGPEAYGAPETMALIQSWFNDEALPDESDLWAIIEMCKNGGLHAVMTHLETGLKPSPKFDAFIERYAGGREAQENALRGFYKILDEFARNVSPLSDQLPPITISHPRIGTLLLQPGIHMIFGLLSGIPVERRQNMIVKICDILRAARDSQSEIY